MSRSEEQQFWKEYVNMLKEYFKIKDFITKHKDKFSEEDFIQFDSLLSEMWMTHNNMAADFHGCKEGMKEKLRLMTFKEKLRYLFRRRYKK